MNFIKYDPSNFLENFRATVEHATENLSGHDEAGGVGRERDVTGHEADVTELTAELAVFLVAEGFERGRVDHALLVAERHRNCVFSDGGLAGGGVGGDEDGLVAFQTRD